MSSNKDQFDPKLPLEARRLHVVAVDGSDSSEKAFEWATKNTHPNDRLTVATGRGMSAKGLIPGFIKDHDFESADEAHKILNKYEQKCREEGRVCTMTRFEYERTPADFAKGLCSLATSSLASDIIMGSRGLSRSRSIFGSSSAATLNNCDVPITIIKDSVSNQILEGGSMKIMKEYGHEY